MVSPCRTIEVSPLPPSPHSHPLPDVVKEHGVGCVWTVATSQSAVENEVWWERQKDMILVTPSCGIYDTCNTQLWDLWYLLCTVMGIMILVTPCCGIYDTCYALLWDLGYLLCPVVGFMILVTPSCGIMILVLPHCGICDTFNTQLWDLWHLCPVVGFVILVTPIDTCNDRLQDLWYLLCPVAGFIMLIMPSCWACNTCNAQLHYSWYL